MKSGLHALLNASCASISDLAGAAPVTASDDQLLTRCDAGVLTLTINRPDKRNALRLDLLDAIGETMVKYAKDTELKCAVITGAGTKCFAAGGDLAELDAVRSTIEAEMMSKRGRLALSRVRNFPLPVIGALNGLALGGGAELAMACDLRVAASNAEIGFLQGQLSCTTAWGGGIDLIASVGSERALDLLLSARRLAADEAAAIGLFDRVCTEGESLSDCLSAFLAPYLKRSRQVLAGYKALAGGHRQASHERLSRIEQTHFITTWTHADHWAAVEAAAAARQKKSRA
jgi:enoyl-CoA hydratase